MHRSAKRTILGVAVVGLSAVVVPTAHAATRHSTTGVLVGHAPLGQSNATGDEIHGGCYLLVVEDPTIPDQYNGEIGTASVTTNPSLQPYAADVTCHVEVNGVAPANSSGSFSGGSVQLGSTPVAFKAADTARVTLCEDVIYWWDGTTQPKVCTVVDSARLFLATATLESLELQFVDPVACPILLTVGQATVGGVPGVLEIRPDGDVYVADPLGLGVNPIYDCPPYENF
jgi:hypothetical protein